ncbi:Permeases of the major facilitator superfamily [Burkholderia cenocepacia H111]|nr:Permeases of the major facilitator superfamily [Burkholderia cenocepacia H111]
MVKLGWTHSDFRSGWRARSAGPCRHVPLRCSARRRPRAFVRPGRPPRPRGRARLHGRARRRARRRPFRVHAAVAADARGRLDRPESRRLACVRKLCGLLRRRGQLRGAARRAGADGALRARGDRAADRRDGHRSLAAGVARRAFRRGRRQCMDVRVHVAMGVAASGRAGCARMERGDLRGAGRRHRGDGADRQCAGRPACGGGLAGFRSVVGRPVGRDLAHVRCGAGRGARAANVARCRATCGHRRAGRPGGAGRHATPSRGRRVARRAVRRTGLRLHHHRDVPAGDRARRAAGRFAVARPVLADVRRGADRRRDHRRAATWPLGQPAAAGGRLRDAGARHRGRDRVAERGRLLDRQRVARPAVHRDHAVRDARGAAPARRARGRADGLRDRLVWRRADPRAARRGAAGRALRVVYARAVGRGGRAADRRRRLRGDRRARAPIIPARVGPDRLRRGQTR